MVKFRYLFPAELGDPFSSIFVNDVGCMAGTMLGRVMLYNFDDRQVETLASFSDEGIRGLYLDQDAGYATLTDGCKSWTKASPHLQAANLNFRSLDRKNTQSVKNVLQRGPLVCVLFPISSTVVNIAKQDARHRAFKLFDFGSSSEIAPCDFDGETLAIIDRSLLPAPPVFRLIQLERNEHLELDNFPRAEKVTLVRLWGANCLVCVIGSSLLIYDYRKQELKMTLTGHNDEILAVDAQDPEILATLARDATVKLWNGRTGECLEEVQIPEANFFLGYPYCLSVSGHRILASADEGVFLVELDVSPEAP